MPKVSINKFKGLRQDVNYPELPLQYCHVCTNLNVDDDVGALKIRGGSVKKYDPALSGYPFTGLVSAFEYRYEVSSETVLIVNDAGTLKTMTDGGAPASLTLPTGPGSTATLASGFQNYYMGYKDHVLITTGNGTTNYILWYGYVNRVNAENTGIFNNVLEDTGYHLLKSQMVSVNGTFSNVNDAVLIGSFYFISFTKSRFIEKRDSTTLQLIERLDVGASGDANAVSLATDGTYLYVAYTYSSGSGVFAKKFNPSGFVLEATFQEVNANITAAGIAADGTSVFVGCNTTTGGVQSLFRLNSSMVQQDEIAMTNILDVCCDTDEVVATGSIFVLKNSVLGEYQKIDFSVVTSNATKTNQLRCAYFLASTNVFTTSTTGTGSIYIYNAANVSGAVTTYTTIENPRALILQNSLMRAISIDNGTVESTAASGDGSTIFPEFIGLTVNTTGSGSLNAGTYFYKIAVEDMDGQIYTLSDPVIQVLATSSENITIRLTCHDDSVNYYYRIKNINIFRAYSETQDTDVPTTDYKFLKAIDINSSGWTDDTTDHEIYYYDHLDIIDEDTISTTTYLEMSGIDDTVRPRYVNGKYFTWINDQLHMANFSHDGETYRNRIIRSADNAPDGLAFYDYYDFDVGVGEAINGITEINGRAIIFKERKMGMFYDGRWEQTFKPGAHNSHAFYKVNDVIYYVSTKGIHAFDGSRLINIHYPIIDDFNSVSKDTYPPNVFYVDGKDRLYFIMRGGGAGIYSTRTKTWSFYDSSMAFRGCFKNYEEEYIGWTGTTFYKFEDGTSVNDFEDFGGGNGTAIAFAYESPLLRFDVSDGQLVVPISHRHRIKKDVAAGATDRVTFIFREYQDDASGRTNVYSKELDSPIGSYAATKNYFFDPIMGESFSTRLEATAIDGGNFEYHGITIDYMPGGYWRGR
jgi:hypothetical protein